MVKRILLGLAAIVTALAVLAVAAYWLFPEPLLEAGRTLRRHSAGLSLREVTVAGHRVVYLEGGNGEPLVLLHGFGADKDNWPPIAAILGKHYRIIALDLPGFGDSTHDPAADYGFRAQAERIEAITQAIGLTAPFHIGGNSMGGAIAGLYAAKYPQRVRSLWLIDPAAVQSAKLSPLFEQLLAGRNPMIVGSPEEFDTLVGMLFVNRPWIPGQVRKVLTDIRIRQQPGNAKVFADLRADFVKLEEAVKGCPVPTLITWGDQDRLVDVSGAAILARALPRSTVDILKNVGHVPMIEAPERTAQRYLEFRHSLQ